MPEPDDDKDGGGSFRAAMALGARYFDLAFMLPAGILLGYFVGWLLARWLHAEGWKLGGVLVGVVLGFIGMIRRAIALSSSNGPSGPSSKS